MTNPEVSSGWIRHGHTQAEPVIAPGDRLSLVIWDTEENSLFTALQQKSVRLDDVPVSPAGTVFVPYVNAIRVAGNTVEVARRKIQTKLEDIIPSAQVQLYHEQGAANAVDLVGGVTKPGSYPVIDRHFTILNLISQGGGVTAGLRNPRARLNRAGRTYVRSITDIYENPALDTRLQGGDKVIVEQDTRYFLSLGAAGQESLIHFTKESVTALDAMALVGGVADSRGNPAAILILREYPTSAVRDGIRGPQHQRTIFSLDLTNADGLFSAGRFQIQPKDTVLVTESPITSAQTILGLVGSVFGIAISASSVSD
ncbi:MAG: polysaccharide biosynthesis/export family protein [Pseudomonadota bacterium]